MVITIRRKYVYEDVDRHGNVRLYFWRGGRNRKVRLTEKPGTEAFDHLYHQLLKDGEAGVLKMPPRDAPTPGTFRWLCVEHFKSVQFKQLDPRTQHTTKLIVEKMYEEPIAQGEEKVFGDCPLPMFTAKAVRILRDRRADRPGAANNRVKRLRRIFAWALSEDHVTFNPAQGVQLLKPRRAGGFPVWSTADIEKFEAHWPIGSKPRLALTLLFYTGGRRSDVVSLGRQHVRSNVLSWRMHKGRNRHPMTMEIPILPDLREVLEASPTGDLAFLVTDKGRPYSAAGFTNWFRDRCNEAGLTGLSAHGLRKAAATRLAERGATAHQLMGIFGWRNINQAEVYTRAASRHRLASEAMHLLGTETVQIFPTSDRQARAVGKKRPKK